MRVIDLHPDELYSFFQCGLPELKQWDAGGLQTALN